MTQPEVPASRKAALLAQHAFFRDLPAPTLETLAARSRSATYAKGEIVFSKGDEGFGLFGVARGRVKISALSSEGKEITFNIVGPGDVFGEIALLDGLPRTADAIALEPCELVALDRRDFLTVLGQDPVAALKMLEVVSRRLRRTSEQVEALTFRTAPARLAQALLGLIGPGAENGSAQIAITQRELGQAAGLSRESTNKLLREWQEAGWLTITPGRIAVLDRRALAAIA